MRLIPLIALVAALVSCAPAEPPQVQTDAEGHPIARIALVDEHPFDLKNLIEGKGARHLAAFLRLVDAKDTNVIDTNYDSTKSLVTVIAGDYPSGGTLVLDFIRVAGRKSEYTVTSSFPAASRNRPAVVINSYRINRRADVDVTARINGQAVAFKRFKAQGPTDEPESGWPLLSGDTALSAEELERTLVGNNFALENDGTVYFRSDGTVVRSRSRGTRMGPYEIRDDGITCVHYSGDRERCYRMVEDAQGNLTIINDRARRYRMEPT